MVFQQIKQFFNNLNRDPELKVTMLGPSRVGKSSLLVAMYQQFNATIGAVGKLRMEPNFVDGTGQRLEESLIALKQLCDRENVIVTAGKGLAGNAQVSEYMFSLKHDEIQEQEGWKLKFTDYPGGFMQGTPTQKRQVQAFMQEADVILVVIDAVALMETEVVLGEPNRSHHETFNAPTTIFNIFENSTFTSAKLVMLCPTKCEKYLRTEEGTNKLLETVTKQYSSLLKNLEKRDRVAVIINPVETVGCAIFSRMKRQERDLMYEYIRDPKQPDYSPSGADRLLIFLFAFLFKQGLQRRTILVQLKDLLNGTFKQSVKDTAHQLLLQAGQTTRYRIIQGADLFQIK